MCGGGQLVRKEVVMYSKTVWDVCSKVCTYVHVGTREYTPKNVINYFRWVHVYMLQQQIDYCIIAKLTIMT